jgi:hypothetical protein
MTSSVKRFKLELSDWLRYSPAVRGTLGRYGLIRDRIGRRPDSQARVRSVHQLCGVARLMADDDTALCRVERRIRRRAEAVDLGSVDWSEFVPGMDDPRISKAAVLKPRISPREPGAVFISFEDQWAKLLKQGDLAGFARDYALVVSPTWCPPHSVVNCLFPNAYPGPVYSLISNPRDLSIFPRLSSKYAMVPLYASSWVNPEYFAPRPRSVRDIDIVMVANFGKYKRHHALFRALGQMPGTRAVLVGQSQGGRTADTIRSEAGWYGVADRVKVLSHVTNETLADCLCRAKVSVILSRREGSCVVVAESLFADTPVALLEGAEVGSAAFINERTGRFVPENDLAAGLTDFLDRAETYTPRHWAESNISCFRSTEVLNRLLQEQQRARGGEWTRDLAPICWRPDPQLVRPEDASWERAERERIKSLYGIEIV